MKWIVGLGNPGPQYSLTRHNVGFLVMNALQDILGAEPFRPSIPSAETSVARVSSQPVLLIKPLTYMNQSGEALSSSDPSPVPELQDLLVIYDDADLAFGKLRFRPSGGDGGHNGVRSIINALGDRDFCRLKVGVRGAERPAQQRLADYVLESFSEDEQKDLDSVILGAAQAAKSWCVNPLKTVMNSVNGQQFLARPEAAKPLTEDKKRSVDREELGS